MSDTTLQAALRAAFDSKLSVIAQTLTEDQQTQALENMGVISALEELITEYGGTVPNSGDDPSTNALQGVTTIAAQSDPWNDFN